MVRVREYLVSLKKARGLTYLYPRDGSLPSWQAAASQPCRRAVTHSLPRALARSPLTLAFLGCL